MSKLLTHKTHTGVFQH